MRVNLSVGSQPVGCHAPLQAGHPVIPARQFEAKPCENWIVRIPRTITTESYHNPRIHEPSLAGSATGSRQRPGCRACSRALPDRARTRAGGAWTGGGRDGIIVDGVGDRRDHQDHGDDRRGN